MDTRFNYSGFVDLFLGPEERAGTPGAEAVSASGAARPEPPESARAADGPVARTGPRTCDP